MDLIRLYLGVALFFKGLYFMSHGDEVVKLIEAAGPWGFAPAMILHYTVLAHVFGGLMLAAGLFTRIAAIPIAFAMLVAVVQVHLKNGFFAGGGGYEFPLTLAVAAIALVLTGGGAWALDNVLGTEEKLFGRRRRPFEVRRAA
jgi:putative oxidoreductase